MVDLLTIDFEGQSKPILFFELIKLRQWIDLETYEDRRECFSFIYERDVMGRNTLKVSAVKLSTVRPFSPFIKNK